MALSKEQIEKLQKVASAQQKAQTDNSRTIISHSSASAKKDEPEEKTKSNRRFKPWIIIMIVAFCAAIITIVIIFTINNPNSSLNETTNSLTESIKTPEGEITDEDLDINNSSNGQTFNPTLSEDEFSISLPNSITGIESEEEAKQIAISYGFTFEGYSENGTFSFMITPEEQEHILETLYNDILTTLNGLKTTEVIYDYTLSDDVMSARIIVDTTDTDYTGIAEQISDSMILYGYFLGYEYMEPTVSFYNIDGTFENFITITI